MKVKNKKRRVKDEKMETPLRTFFTVHYSLFSYFSLFSLHLFGLPNFDSVLRFSIEFVSFFDIESLIPSLHIG